MKSELICVGTELLFGKLNTNAAYIGERLSTIGLDLSFVTSVGDNSDDMFEIFKKALDRSNIIIITGGLGPTFDDITREVAAKVLGRNLKINHEILNIITKYFNGRNIYMPKENERQAYIIDGAKIIKNQTGTAPGQCVEIGSDTKKLLFLLPGPPREMQPMFENDVFPYFENLQKEIKKSFILHICGLPESVVDEKIKPVIDNYRVLNSGGVNFTILAHDMIVDIKVSAAGTDEISINKTLDAIKQEFYSLLNENIFGEDSQSLEDVVGSILAKNKKTIAVAESCTGGLLSGKITSIPGSSEYFKEGIVTYSNEAKVRYLGVKEETLKNFGAVSEQTAAEMADGLRKISGADYAASVTGIAGPSGGTPEKPVGLVYAAISGENIKHVIRLVLPGNRNEIRERTVNKVLDFLRRQLYEAIYSNKYSR